MRFLIRFARHVTAVVSVILIFGISTGKARAEVVDEGLLLLLAQIEVANDHLTGVLGLEPKALAAGGDWVMREGNRLLVRVQSGLVKTYSDLPACENIDQESKCEKFRLVAHSRSRHLFLVVQAGYETVQYIVIDDVTGDEVRLAAFPLFSPSGSQIIVLNVKDSREGFAIQIWSRLNNVFNLKWTGAPFAHVTPTSLTTYSMLGWNSDRAVAIEAETRDDPPTPRRVKRFILNQTLDEWRLVEVR